MKSYIVKQLFRGLPPRAARPLVAGCAFSNCTHLNEPGCAIRAAVAAGQIAVSRYQSYCRMRLGESYLELTGE